MEKEKRRNLLLTKQIAQRAKEEYAVRKVTTTESEIVQFRQDVQTKLRQRVREAIETVLDEELAAALGCEAYQRCKGRRGYRNGSEQRPLTTEIGTRDIRVPRGRLQQNDGTTAEFRSELLPRYAAARRSSTRRSSGSTWPGPTRDASARPWSRCWGRPTCPRVPSPASSRV